MDVRVLVIDDDLIIRRLFSIFLDKKGYKVISVASGEEGLEILNNNKVDIISCDVMMPGMSGLDLIKIIKSVTRLKNIPVVMLSATGSQDELAKMIDLGASTVLAKPCTPADLEKTIRNTLGLKF